MAGPLPKSPPVTWNEALAGVRSLDPLLPTLKKPPDPHPSFAGEGETTVVNQLSEEDLADCYAIEHMYCRPCPVPSDKPTEMRACTARVKPPSAYPAKHRPAFGLVGLLSTPEKVEAIVDTGATYSVTPHQSDFIVYEPEQGNEVLKGLSTGCAIAGRGIIQSPMDNASAGNGTASTQAFENLIALFRFIDNEIRLMRGH